jgi:mannose-6-phosphate isomerase-like protein (cupin superfamily)
MRPTIVPLALAISLASGTSAFTNPAFAQEKAPPSYKAQPDVYKLLSENEHFRVIEATWKPGQRDAWHSHEGQLAAYRLTDCTSRIHAPGGTSEVRNGKAGGVTFNPVIQSHSFENIGAAECKTIFVEKK